MPEIYVNEDLKNTRNCLRNGFIVLTVAVVFWAIMGAMCYRALTLTGGM